jgi:serine/threonine-protein kinase HipA
MVQPAKTRTVAVFAHIANPEHLRHEFVPAAELESAQSTGQPARQRLFYGTRYLKRPYAVEIDPRALPLKRARAQPGTEFRPLEGLDHFGGLRDAAPDAWGRRVIENKLKAPANSLDEFTYLIEAGSERVGALDVRESREAEASVGVGNLVNLEYLLQAAAKVEQGEPVPAQLLPYLAGTASAGGARPKATVRDGDKVLWLAKFPARSDTYRMAVMEAGALELARMAGITVPPAHVSVVKDAAVLMIRRFDRYWAQPGVPLPSGVLGYETAPAVGLQEGRIAQCTALTLMGLHEADSPNASYADLAHAIRAHALPARVAADTQELFARMVLNIFLNNNDDHLRNHSFSYDVVAQGWHLSPLYDVVPQPQMSQERYLHLGVGAQGRLATLDNAMSHYGAFVQSRPQALEIIRQVWSVVRTWKTVFEQHGAGEKEMHALESAIRPLSRVASAELEKSLRQIG